MALTYFSVHQAATDLLDCVCAGLDRMHAEVPGLDGCPCRTCVVPGRAVADGCGEGCGTVPEGQFPGQLTVSVVRIYSTGRKDFPRYNPSSADSIIDDRSCAPQRTTAIDLLVTLYRCTPTPTDDGCPPSCEDLNSNAMQLHADILAIQSAIECCYAGTDPNRPRGRRFTIGQSAVLDPQGACVGIEQQVTVALDDVLPAAALVP